MQATSRIRDSLLSQLCLAAVAAFLILQLAILVDYRGLLKAIVCLGAWIGVNVMIGFGLNHTPEAKLRSFVGSCLVGMATMIGTIILFGYAD